MYQKGGEKKRKRRLNSIAVAAVTATAIHVHCCQIVSCHSSKSAGESCVCAVDSCWCFSGIQFTIRTMCAHVEFNYICKAWKLTTFDILLAWHCNHVYNGEEWKQWQSKAYEFEPTAEQCSKRLLIRFFTPFACGCSNGCTVYRERDICVIPFLTSVVLFWYCFLFHTMISVYFKMNSN